MFHQCCVTSQRRTCWLPDLTLTFCCVHEKSRPIYLLHVRQNHAFSHLWLHILPKSRLFPVFVACSPKSRVFPPHTPTPPHHTGRGYKSRLFPLIPCSPKSRFSHLFLHVRKIHAYSHFLLRKKLRNLHLFCETPSVFPLLLHVCQNHAYSHLLLHVRRNHVYSLHTQSIKEFLRFCEKSRKFNFTPHGAGV